MRKTCRRKNFLMIEQLRAKFAAQVPPRDDNPGQSTASDPAIESERCGTCGSTEFWKPIGGDDWLCARCRPAPTKAFIAATRRGSQIVDQIKQPVSIVSKCQLTHDLPWCLECNCRLAVEVVWSDGTVTLTCWTCKADMPPRVSDNPLAAEMLAEYKNSQSNHYRPSRRQGVAKTKLVSNSDISGA